MKRLLIAVVCLMLALYFMVTQLPINESTIGYLAYVDLKHDVVLTGLKYGTYTIYSEVAFYRKIYLFSPFIERTKLEISSYVYPDRIEEVKKEHEAKLHDEFVSVKERFKKNYL